MLSSGLLLNLVLELVGCAAVPVPETTLVLLVGLVHGGRWRSASEMRRVLARAAHKPVPSVQDIGATFDAVAAELGVSRRVSASGTREYCVRDRAHAFRLLSFRAKTARKNLAK